MNYLKKIENILKIFTEKKAWIALAESCTGGFISHIITNISGASKVFERGIVCYSNQAKIEVLNVDPAGLERNGAVSETVAFQLAKNVRETARVTVGIGITGIAGPTGGTPQKPVGLVYIGYSSDKETVVDKHVIKANRINFKKKVLEKIILKLEDFILHDFQWSS